LIVYGDASALVKRYLAEAHSDRAIGWFDLADQVASSRVALVEVTRAIANAGARDEAAKQTEFGEDWSAMWVVELRRPISENAAILAVEERLRSLDAIHLASALSIRASDLHFATFDERLWRVARRAGLNVLPETWP
jgi:predicted nucleic acid-binding protein